MANANMKWDKHQMDVLQKVKQDLNPVQQIRIAEEDDNDDEESALDGGDNEH